MKALTIRGESRVIGGKDSNYIDFIRLAMHKKDIPKLQKWLEAVKKEYEEKEK